MNTVFSWQGALLSSWGRVWASFLSFLPIILGAILIFSVGLVIAYWAKRLAYEMLKAAKSDRLEKYTGLDKFFQKADIKMDLAQLIGLVVEWLIILVFFLAAVDILGLRVVSQVLTKVLSYIPNIFAAVLIFAAGYFVAGIVDGLVRSALASVNHDAAKPLGKFARWLIILITFFTAVDQLQIAQGLIATFFQGLTYTIVLVVGLSVGLGAKDLVSRILNDWYDKLKK
ncbi:MAG: Conserved cytoplasmic membrane protein, CmpX protein [Candidatus Woesebacteria bacterium GW2011_GWA1_37_7]|uniref:Conserved cytoplasmic membrane protein, CmpX protein n=1 Tax=Candidatus Woesebacteria bacterium GW2011_GWA1_37_7 TaxID=1618545 RepID=A0A0G0HHA6_9BACT|nr:MAG: Conserved cytoplasmic membrane protein, CmpX protein [Candidatus Woesebacteria bacterium GW2011_GWA1_37_7]